MNGSIRNIVLAVAAMLMFGCCFIGFTVYSWVNGVHGTATDKETQLSGAYVSYQAVLDELIVGVREQVGLNFAAGDQVEDILRGALEGRYGEEGFTTDSALFLAVSEAYPDTDQLFDLWGDLQQYVQDGRARIRNTQTKLIDQAEAYRNWLERDLFRRWAVQMLGYPSRTLEARIGDTIYFGDEALARMLVPITSSDTREAFETGTFEGVEIPSRRSNDD